MAFIRIAGSDLSEPLWPGESITRAPRRTAGPSQKTNA